MLTEKLLKLLEVFPVRHHHYGPIITYDIKYKTLILVVWIDNVRNDFHIEESELDDMDKLISDIKDLHAKGT